MKLLGATPYLRVADVERSLRFYCDGLGFTVSNRLEEHGHTFWALVTNGAFTLMLSDRPSRFIEDGAHEPPRNSMPGGGLGGTLRQPAALRQRSSSNDASLLHGSKEYDR